MISALNGLLKIMSSRAFYNQEWINEFANDDINVPHILEPDEINQVNYVLS